MDTAAPLHTPVLPTEAAVSAIEPFLETLLNDLEPVRMTPTAGRPRILPSTCLWAGVLVCLLRGATTQTAVWRLLTQKGLWHYPVRALSDQAIFRRLDRESVRVPGTHTAIERLFLAACAALRTRLAPYADYTLAPFAKEVFAVDQVTLDQVARTLPALRALPAGDDGLFPGKLEAVFDLRRQLWHQVTHLPSVHQNEKKSLPSLLDTLAEGILLVFDLGYFSFAWFDALCEREVFWVSRLRQQTSYSVQHIFYQQGDTLDALVWLGAYRADRGKHMVRLVTFRVGTVPYRYLTNQVDPALLPLHEIARVYQRRWDIEMGFALIKEHFKLHFLWSAKTHVLLAQVWGVLLISQVLQALRLEIAAKAGVDVFDVSIALLVEYAPQYLADGQDPVEAFVQDGRRLRFIRPSRRTENRAPFILPRLLTPTPPDLVSIRVPRYAHSKDGPRARAYTPE